MLIKIHETHHEQTELTKKIAAEINTLGKNEAISNENCTEQQTRNFVIYDDDTTLFIEENETKETTEKRLQYYCDILQSRMLINQWEKVVLITKRKGITIKINEQIITNTAGYKPPYHTVKCKKAERLLGRQISAKQDQTAVQKRKKMANAIFNQLANSIFLNTKYRIETRLQLWNAFIRAILTYGLNTTKLTNAEEEIVNNMTIRHMTKMFNPKKDNKQKYFFNKKKTTSRGADLQKWNDVPTPVEKVSKLQETL